VTFDTAMHNFLDSIPSETALFESADGQWTAAALRARIAALRAALERRSAPSAPVAILADNCPDWIAVDLCTQQMGITLVPLPLFFTPAQWVHVIAESGAQAIFCSMPQHAAALGFGAHLDCPGALALFQTSAVVATRPFIDTQKITFTSGTTAAPKGVCLSTEQQWGVARGLESGLAALSLRRHLCLLPFAVLLENIAGPYTAMLSGATTICPSMAEVGLSGSSGFDAEQCLAAIARYQPHSVILLPQMLQALVAAVVPDDPRIASLRFVAVGGAKSPRRLLEAAAQAGFPVYEGYGLSECSSVVALNLPGAARAGSVGRALPGRRLRIADDGEICIDGVRARYLGHPESVDITFATGDLGHIDEDGYVYIDGRKKDILITGFGRNISPEWPESMLIGTGRLAQALVVGDGQPDLAALIVPFPHHDSSAAIQAAIDLANADLPDYARIQRWKIAAPFTVANGLATANGRLRRTEILTQYRHQIADLYNLTESPV
jgi:long-chain acyl-CoA synthetase